MSLWYDEIHNESIRFGLKIKRTLFVEQSPFQKVTVVETEAMGNALLIDDLWMTAEKDEATYHELLVHPAMTTAPNPKRVLIIGGGDGGSSREVLRHACVERLDLIEIDGAVVEASKQFLPSIGSAWDDPRLHLTIGDGIDYVKNADVEPYDVILIDGSDPVGPAEGLFNEAFFRGCARLLAKDGVFAAQSESPNFHRDIHVETIHTLGKVFEHVHPYYGTVTIYPGGAWSWIYASNTRNPLTDVNEERAKFVESYAFLYNRDIHRGAFAVPNHVRKALAKEL